MKKELKTGGVIGIDPGISGGIVYLSNTEFRAWPMPTNHDGVRFGEVCKLINQFKGIPIFLERAVSFGMGTKGAFNYGKGFGYVEIAIKLSTNPVTYVEPKKWTKEMHAGIDSNFKPKIKSLIAVERLFPNFFNQIPQSKKGKLHDGIVDALLIAGYGLKLTGGQKESEDFY